VASPSYERVSTSLFDGNATSPIFMVRIGKEHEREERES
jgi:hypothetical protein